MTSELIARMTHMKLGDSVNLVLENWQDGFYVWGTFVFEKRVRACIWCKNSALCEVFVHNDRKYIFHIRGSVVPHVVDYASGKSYYVQITEDNNIDNDALQENMQKGMALRQRRRELSRAHDEARRMLDSIEDDQSELEKEIDEFFGHNSDE